MSHITIDRDKFLFLAVAIASSRCSPAGVPTTPEPPTAEPVPVEVAIPIAAEPAQVVEVPPSEVANEDDTPLDEPSCRNDEGEVSCDFIHNGSFQGPACEGFAGTCELLKQGYGYKPRVAAAVAACFDRVGRAACSMHQRQQCFREALRVACPDPQFTAHCEATLDRCRQQRKVPDFDVTECVQALSSLEGGNLEWAKNAIGPSAEGCKLMFPVY